MLQASFEKTRGVQHPGPGTHTGGPRRCHGYKIAKAFVARQNVTWENRASNNAKILCIGDRSKI